MPLKTRGHFRLPDCNVLPRYNSSTAAEHPICSYVGLTEMNLDDITCKPNFQYSTPTIIMTQLFQLHNNLANEPRKKNMEKEKIAN